jgi:hypothetical protein
LTWADSPTAPDGSASHINNDKLSIEAFAGVNLRSLTVIAGLNGSGTLTTTLHLSDGSIPDVVNTQSFSASGVRIYTIQFASATAGRTLSVTFTRSGGEFLIYGAALNAALVPEPHYLQLTDNLQGFVNTVQAGDSLVLPDGYAFAGHVILPVRADTGWVTITSNVTIPAGQRVHPGDLRAAIISPDEQPAIQNDLTNPDHTQRPAHGWRFTGVEITANNPAAVNYNLVLLGYGDNPTLADAPSHFDFERCYIHGDGVSNYNRGILGNANDLTVKDSYLSGFVSDYMEANTINIYSSAGPIKIVNNYLEAAAENVMIGGSGPDVGPPLVPTYGVIQYNYFAKLPNWMGGPWIVKNLLEFKDGYNFTVDSNVFEYSWIGAQGGYAIVMTPRTGSGGTSANHVDTITFTNNIIRHVGSGVLMGLYDDLSVFPQSQLLLAHDITLKNNLFDDLSNFYAPYSHGTLIVGPPNHTVLDHNTYNFRESTNDHGWWLIGLTGETTSNAIVTNNYFGQDLYGDSRGGGPLAILTGAIFTGNVIQNANPSWNASPYAASNKSNVAVIPTAVGADAAMLLANEPFIENGNPLLPAGTPAVPPQPAGFVDVPIRFPAGPVAAPAFSPGSGAYTSMQSVTISTTTTGAAIRYTTDGSTPSETAGTLYSAPIAVGSAMTIKAIAYATGMTDSAVATVPYTISVPKIAAAAPAFSPGSGAYTSAQSVAVATTTKGASIRYTTDGSTPSETAGTLYRVPIAVLTGATIKAIAYGPGMTNSTLASATYAISAVNSPNNAQFVKTDLTTQGSWSGVYGTSGYNVIDGTAVYPSGVRVTPSNQLNWIWAGSTTDARALQLAPSSTSRIAATWYTPASFSIDVVFSDTAQHQLAIYCIDFDHSSRAQTLSILDGTSNTVLDTRSVTHFDNNGEWVVWNVSGYVIVKVTNNGPVNAVISGLFLGGGSDE